MSTLRAEWDRWLSERYRAREINAKSHTVLRARFRDLGAVHGDRPISTLDRQTMRRWSRQVGHLSAPTRRAYLSTVSGFCRWAVAEGLLDSDPTVGVARIREPRRVPRARPAADIARILDVARDPRSRLIVLLMVGMGLRCLEIARLQVGDYDRHTQTMLIHGKADNERTLPVPSSVATAIDEYRDRIGWLAGPLVCSVSSFRYGISAHYVSQLVTSMMYSAGIKRRPGDGVTPHALRHTAASDVLDMCHDVRLVQNMLGHGSLATTQIYLRRASLGQLREAMAGRSYDAAPVAG